MGTNFDLLCEIETFLHVGLSRSNHRKFTDHFLTMTTADAAALRELYLGDWNYERRKTFHEAEHYLGCSLRGIHWRHLADDPTLQ